MRDVCHRLFRRTLATATATACVAALAVVASAPPAQAAPCPTKCYSAVIAPAQYAAGFGEPQEFSVTVRNLTERGGQQLGSINVTPPPGFTIRSVDQPATGSAKVEGNVIQLRDLDLAGGNSETYTWTADTPTQEGTYTWSIAAKQSNDFQGAGNDFIQDASASSTATEGVKGAATCIKGAVSCATGVINYAAASSVSTGSVVSKDVWHVGTISFPATKESGSQPYSMAAVPPEPLVCAACTFQMNMDDIPGPYTAAYPAELTLLVHGEKAKGSNLLMFKQSDPALPGVPLAPCGLVPGQTCFEYARVGTDLKVTVKNLTAGDPKIAGMTVA